MKRNTVHEALPVARDRGPRGDKFLATIRMEDPSSSIPLRREEP